MADNHTLKSHRLSVVLAVHNEEKNLTKCLQPIAKVADEIVIADGDSTDKTVSIAKKFGAKVISTTNKANFHINKQMAMDAAKGDLVLQLDADEVLDDQLVQFIDQLKHPESNISKQNQHFAAWWIKRKNFFLGRWLSRGGHYPDPVIRLYWAGKAKLPQKDVHEQMIVDGKVGWADGHMLHYSNPSFSDYLQKFDRYTSFKAHQLKDAGVKTTFESSLKYLIWLPSVTFFMMYFRHRGFVDGLPGFVFAAWSGLHHVVAFLKLWELNNT